MNRLGIFIFYDACGIVDQYVEVLLEGLLTVLNKLVIVINGNITNTSERKLRRYSANIFARENIGFDGGGYKDALLNLKENEKWEQWDEVIFCNDTFYGAIFPWKQVFDRMQKEENVDFWGLSRYPGDDLGEKGFNYPSHIQSYFLVCRKRLLLNPVFWNFWTMLKYPDSRENATRDFEVKFTTYFSEKGYLGKAYMDICDNKIVLEHKGSPYMHYAYELLKELRFPIIKRNALVITNFKVAQRAMEYIDKYSNYNVNLIYDHLKRLAKENRIKSFNPGRLEDFYNSHSRVFIYGYGEYGQNVEAYFKYKGWRYEGIIVSVKDIRSSDVYTYDEVQFKENDGIVLALGKNAYQEVYSKIGSDFTKNQILALF
jgi:rhamnosyltransferase